jgi:hypothetical protein
MVITRVSSRRIGDRWRRLLHDDRRWFVLGHIDHLRLRRRNLHHVLLDDDRLLVIALQIARGLRLSPEGLDGLEHVRLLRDDCLAERLRPAEIVAHQRERPPDTSAD